MNVTGKTVVLTGTFVGVTRPVAEAGLAARGARVASAVSKRTDIVFAGADPGSKLEKARALGIAIAHEAALLAILTGQASPPASLGAHPFHAAFDRLAAEVSSHPRVHVVALHRGPPRDPETLDPGFVRVFGVAPGDDVRSFYAARDGCALVWMDREDAAFDATKHRFEEGMPVARMFDDLVTESTHAIVMPGLDHVLGANGMDYACQNAQLGGARERYQRSFVAFDFPGGYYTPAFVVERARLAVQVGDDHGVFDDGRPTVSFDAYLEAVIATKGSIRSRHDLFGLHPSPARVLGAAPTIDDLLGPTRAAKAEAAAKAAALATEQPTDPRLRALVEAIASGRSSTRELQKDGRTLVRVERADGSKQLTFLREGELVVVDRALAAQRR